MAQPWERTEEETPKAYEAFCIYRDLGPERSLAKAAAIRAKNTGKKTANVRQFQRWSSDFAWFDRVRKYDDHINQRALELREADLVKRRADLKQAEWDASQALIARALEVNQLPLKRRILTETEETPDGKTIINHYKIEPVRVAARDAVRFLDMGSKLGRLATDLSTNTERMEHTGKDGGPIEYEDVGLTDDERASRLSALYERIRERARAPDPDEQVLDSAARPATPGVPEPS